MAATKTSSSTDKKSVNKSDYIRSLPSTMSAADVVAKAKAEGIPLDAALVYKVRRRANVKAAKKAGPSNGSSASAAAKGSSPAKKASSVASKAEFVRSHANLSPKEIVQKAAAAGIKLGVGYVYNVRGAEKATKATSRKGRAPTRPSAAASTTTAAPRNASAPAAEGLLMAVAAEVGLGRAIELLEAQRARVFAVMGT